MANRTSKPTNQIAVNRRTLVVWSSLIASMTIASGLLLLLEQRPLAPVGGLALSALDNTPTGIDAIFHTRKPATAERWDSIVIHHSGQQGGSAERIGELHQALGYHGLGYHFVIGNGDGAVDGLIQVGYRWMDQHEGQYVSRAISICLVGNGDKAPPTAAQMDQLTRLVNALQARLHIPADRVFLHSDLVQTTSPGRYFPAQRLRNHLVEVSVR